MNWSVQISRATESIGWGYTVYLFQGIGSRDGWGGNLEFVEQAYRLEVRIGVDVVVLRQNISVKPQLAMKAFD